jgi:hypothetical protein
MPAQKTTTNGTLPLDHLSRHLLDARRGIDWWHTYRHRPITEDQIRREMDRLRGPG